MPEKLEFEEWMILVMAFNLLNTNKQKAAQSRACNQFAIRPGLWAARHQGRSAWHNSVQVGVCLCVTHLIYQVRSQVSASGCSFTECPAGFLGVFFGLPTMRNELYCMQRPMGNNVKTTMKGAVVMWLMGWHSPKTHIARRRLATILILHWNS